MNGVFNWTLLVKSDCYRGLDQEIQVLIKVLKETDVKRVRYNILIKVIKTFKLQGPLCSPRRRGPGQGVTTDAAAITGYEPRQRVGRGTGGGGRVREEGAGRTSEAQGEGMRVRRES